MYIHFRITYLLKTNCINIYMHTNKHFPRYIKNSKKIIISDIYEAEQMKQYTY